MPVTQVFCHHKVLSASLLSSHHAEAGASNQVVLENASRMLRQKYGIKQTTIQVEEWKEEMGDRGICQLN